ncbi:Frag1/DRAM/Sfk1 [Armillaria novae-zelandiae]|uniref:Frag1/DRAM/Sfk1 n=1 Tax=Armillaria novae-zelandiae TaxID=153914 RepID=A0AA39PKY5_9AGAR|nr:Frag1/DRAM/Sfk1 [Armillaria novae-zelandiae]
MSGEHQHWAYIWIPVLGGFMWFSTLLSMLITWLATGRPHYVSMDGSIAYISDIGADILKPLFIAGCGITAVCFFLSLCVERGLRHAGRLMPHMRTRERIFGHLAMFGSFVGGCGLILLSIFDTKRYTSLHRIFLLVFMLGVAISAIFTVIEFRWLSRDFQRVRTLKIAYLAKAIIATILILLAFAFGVALYRSTNVGAVLEWTISFGFTLYLLTFFFDLRQSRGVQPGELGADKFTTRTRPHDDILTTRQV